MKTVFLLGGPCWPHTLSASVPNYLSNAICPSLLPSVLISLPLDLGLHLLKAYVLNRGRKGGCPWPQAGWTSGEAGSTAQRDVKQQFPGSWWCIWWEHAAMMVSRQVKRRQGLSLDKRPWREAACQWGLACGSKVFWNQHQGWELSRAQA